MPSRKDLKIRIAAAIKEQIGQEVLYVEQVGNLIKHLFGIERSAIFISHLFEIAEKVKPKDLGIKMGYAGCFGCYRYNPTYFLVKGVWRILQELAEKRGSVILAQDIKELLAEGLHLNPPPFSCGRRALKKCMGTARLGGNGAIKPRKTMR